jgi:Condensation domain
VLLHPEAAKYEKKWRIMISAKHSTIEVANRSGETRLPLSYAEELLLRMQATWKNSTAYNYSLAYRGTDDDAEVFMKVARGLVKRHEILRTRFYDTGRGLRREILPPSEMPVAIEACSGSATEDRTSLAKQRMAEQHEKPFDLDGGPLWRFTILRGSAQGDRETYFHITTHVLTCDGRSLYFILGMEISGLFDQVKRNVGPWLAPRRIQYADYAVWQRSHLTPEALEPHVTYWRKHLASAPVYLELPTDRPRTPEAPAENVKFTLAEEVVDALAHLARQERTTLFTVLFAAYALLLHRQSSQDQVVVGIPVEQRANPDLANMVGLLTDLMPINVTFSGKPSFKSLVRQIHESVVRGREHSDVPLIVLADALKLHINPLHTPLCQVMFNFVGADPVNTEKTSNSQKAGDESSSELRMLQSVPVDAKRMVKMDVMMTVLRWNGLQFRIGYNAVLFNRDRMISMAEQYRQVISRAIVDPDATSTDYCL